MKLVGTRDHNHARPTHAPTYHEFRWNDVPVGLITRHTTSKSYMEYGVTRLVLACKHFLPISEEEFKAIRQARQHSIQALGMEEKLDMMLQNYAEYEHELLQITLGHALFSLRSWSDFTGIIHQIDRRLVNLLSAARLYLDQLQHDIGHILGSETIERLISSEYDSRPGYRAMEALRNYVQHRGLPLHSITLGGEWIETTGGDRRKENTVLYLNIEKLKEDDKFKRSVLMELTGEKGNVPLKPLVRDYITGIMRIQKGIRDELAVHVAAWDERLQSLIRRYRSEVEDEALGLCAVIREPDGSCSERVEIFTEFIERRQWLERKNRGAGELRKIIITSE